MVDRPRFSLASLTGILAPAGLAAYVIVGIACSVLVQLAGFMSLREAGYGDSYVLYDVLSFEKTGRIYRNLAEPPYLPAQYSPLVYMTYSLSRWLHFSNIFLGPRLIAFAIFLFCLGMTVSIVKKLIPVRFAWLWGILIAGSITRMDEWVLQLRGDFLGIFFGLAAIRLLMSRYRFAVLTAGLCAGMAIQIKLTLLAASASGFLWLLLRRRWRDALLFTLGASATSVGLFFVYWLREPNMIRQMTTVMPGIKDVQGSIFHLKLVIHDLVAMLFLAGAVPVAASRIWAVDRQRPNSTLLLTYVCAAAGFGFLADIQAGGNVNYFFECFLAMTPFAVLGAVRLFALSNRRAWVACFVAGVFVLDFLPTNLRALSESRARHSLSRVKESNRQFTRLEDALRGRRILSVDPRVALIDPRPALTEPYLLTYLRRLGRFDAGPLICRIRNAEFEVFVSPVSPQSWRGLPHFEGADLANAVSDSYTPYCTMLYDVFYLRRSTGDSAELKRDLRTRGCVLINQATVQPLP
jgi:hypothetical protein